MAYEHQQVAAEHINGPEAQAWIQEHRLADLQKLRLKYGLQEPYYSRIAQIESQQKGAKKFPSLIDSTWIFPAGIPLEQASSEETAMFKASLVHTPYSADLCAGMGVDSRAIHLRPDSKRHLVNELDEGLHRLLQANLPECEHHCGRAEELDQFLDPFIATHHILPEELTLFVDPDRRPGASKVLALEDAVPNLVVLQGPMLARAQFVLSKHSPMIALNELHKLHHLKAIYVVQLHGENKEILAVQDKAFDGEAKIVAVELAPQTEYSGLDVATNYCGEPLNYIIQPGPALSKSGLHKQMAVEHGWKKLPYGNLYTAEVSPQAHPLVRAYEMVELAKPYKLKTKVERAAVESIGFPDKPDAVRKKLKIKEGDTHKVFAVKQRSEKWMFLCRKIH